MARSRSLLAEVFVKVPALQYLFNVFIEVLCIFYRFFARFGPTWEGKGKGQHELAVLDLVRNKAEHGNPQSVLNVIDDHAWLGGASSLMNIGDRKGAIVDTVVEECQPKVALELGGYIGYSAVRIARKLPAGGKLYSIDPNVLHLQIARSMIEYAGLTNKVQVVQGILETSIQDLQRQGAKTVDFVLIDHIKHLYVSDLQLLQRSGLLRRGCMIVGDNVLVPGAPEFRNYLASSSEFSTVEHMTSVEYSDIIPDIVTVSKYIP